MRLLNRVLVFVAKAYRRWAWQRTRIAPPEVPGKLGLPQEQLERLFGTDIYRQAMVMEPTADIFQLERVAPWCRTLYRSHQRIAREDDLRNTVRLIPESDRRLICRQLAEPLFIKRCAEQVRQHRSQFVGIRVSDD